MSYGRIGLLLVLVSAGLLLVSCGSDQLLDTSGSSGELESASAMGLTSPVVAEVMSENCGDPDPTNVVLHEAFVYDVDGSDMITVIEDPFEDDSLIGYYLAVRRYEDLPIEYYRIIGNEHHLQWNISVFTVDEDIEGDGTWWFYTGSDIFDIVGPVTTGADTDDPTFEDAIKKVKGSKLRHVSATVSFLNGGQVGQWIGVVPVVGQPEQFFEITANTTRQKPNGKWVNIFVVDGDLEGAGSASWWTVSGQDRFIIYEPCGLSGTPSSVVSAVVMTETEEEPRPRP